MLVGAIAGAFGVRGEVRLKSFTDDPEAIASYGPLQTDDGRSFTVKSLRAVKDGFAGRIGGIGSREAAEALKGTALYVARDALPEPDEEEFYFVDLVGLEVQLTDGSVFGTVKAVQSFGAGDLLEILPVGAKRTVLVPFTKEAVPVVEIKAGRVVIDPPAGLLDEASPEGGAEEP